MKNEEEFKSMTFEEKLQYLYSEYTNMKVIMELRQELLGDVKLEDYKRVCECLKNIEKRIKTG